MFGLHLTTAGRHVAPAREAQGRWVANARSGESAATQHSFSTPGPGESVSARRPYLPPAGVEWLLPIYDLWQRLLGGDRVRAALLDRMDLARSHRLLDVGCGTGTLAILIKQRHAGVVVVGLDADQGALDLASRKARRRRVQVHLNRGFSDRLPYRDASFDHICCTFMLSLLSPVQEEATLREVCRVLKEGGSLHLLDLVNTRSRASTLVRLMLPKKWFQFHTANETLAMIREAGFRKAAMIRQQNVWLWPFASYRAER